MFNMLNRVIESKAFDNFVFLLMFGYVIWSATHILQLRSELDNADSKIVMLLEKIDTSVAPEPAPATIQPLPQQQQQEKIINTSITNTTKVAWNTSYLIPSEIFKNDDKLLSVIGIKNNNPCNVKTPKKGEWYGQIGTDKFGHAIFKHPTYSLRASAMTLINYQRKHGCKTLMEIIDRYCESSKEQYVAFLAKRLDVKPDEPIDVMRVMPKLLHAIVTFETGSNPYPKIWYDAFAMFAPLN